MMENTKIVLMQAKTKRSELLSIILKLSNFYASHVQVLDWRMKRLRWTALAFMLIGIAMLGYFILADDMSWTVGFGSVVVLLVATLIISGYERRRDRVMQVMARLVELHEWADYIQRDVLTFDNAQARRHWYSIRIGILKCEYQDAHSEMGGLEMEELIPAPGERADVLLNSIDGVGSVPIPPDLVDDVKVGLNAVLAGLAG